jgi:hypothetical protein
MKKCNFGKLLPKYATIENEFEGTVDVAIKVTSCSRFSSELVKKHFMSSTALGLTILNSHLGLKISMIRNVCRAISDE